MKVARIICCFYLLVVGILAVSQFSPVLAQEEEEAKIEETVELIPKYPKLESTFPGTIFSYEVSLNYKGIEPRSFDLSVTGPADWTTYIASAGTTETRIGSIVLEPLKTYGQEVKIVAFPPVWLVPEPGEYGITLEAGAGDVKDRFELTAVVVAAYELNLYPSRQRLDTKATAGKDNYFSIDIQNSGSAAIDDITFSSRKPEGWTIDFSPDKMDSLSVLDTQTIDVNIKPPSKTIAGDYSITLNVSGGQASAVGLDVRVTVETPTIWGWVGVGVIALVIGSLIVIFMRFGRR